ncbi:unnamed protein product [Rotaria sp. Silwood2]|nr:unnamed protein product [Rotaria sp. Silwood2]CAF2822636.1 unnamed protein product [Rotaria sp. Silwood2]CAF2984768.1 unnamed protein product [Rotaria sp. Silwood2]CAF3910211.1 unnamed protein product [Rotaria sp. Silwood2]CAF4154671.1 unnamed protein product [Rotaria sp. Silwood2]
MSDISSTFPGGLFKNVRVISLSDNFCLFEHKIYDRITRSFPFLTDLTVSNYKTRNSRSSHETSKNNQMSSVTIFSYLTHLVIIFGNIDNAEQLLVDTNTLLPRRIDLKISYSNLQQVIENFTREATRHNCAKIKHLHFNSTPLVHCKDFYLYFHCYKES